MNDREMTLLTFLAAMPRTGTYFREGLRLAEIADRAHLSESQVRRAVNALHDRGLVGVHAEDRVAGSGRGGGHGRWHLTPSGEAELLIAWPDDQPLPVGL
jgi:DNA-binding transcriptional regulator LsrR (DeoR family)